VPRRNLVPKPSALSFEEAACLPTAYLTAYKMLFEKSGVQPGATMLVQGAGGGVATALIVLGRAAGYRMWATSRTEASVTGPSNSVPIRYSRLEPGCRSESTW